MQTPVRCLSHPCTGLLHDPYHTPSNPAAISALSALLTQSLAARLAEPDPRPLLLCLNSSLETAQVIWNSSMREELTKVRVLGCLPSFLEELVVQKQQLLVMI